MLILAGCGFQPVYAPAGSGGAGDGFVPAALRQMSVEHIRDREGQILRGHLLRLLHPAGAAPNIRYVLLITLSESKSNLAVKKSAFSTRANLTMSAGCTVKDRETGEALFSTNVQVTSGYNIFQSEYQTLAAERGTRERALEELAYEIRSRLGASMALVEKERREKAVPKP